MFVGCLENIWIIVFYEMEQVTNLSNITLGLLVFFFWVFNAYYRLLGYGQVFLSVKMSILFGSQVFCLVFSQTKDFRSTRSGQIRVRWVSPYSVLNVFYKVIFRLKVCLANIFLGLFWLFYPKKNEFFFFSNKALK